MTSPAVDQLAADSWWSPAELHDLVLRAAQLPGADRTLVLYYATAVPLGQPVRKPVSGIGAELGLSSTTASRSVKRLEDAGWLAFAYAAAGVRFYRLGPTSVSAAAETADDDQGEQLATVSHLPVTPLR